MYNARHVFLILNKSGVSRQISVEVPNMKRQENPCSEGGADTYVQKKKSREVERQA